MDIRPWLKFTRTDVQLLFNVNLANLANLVSLTSFTGL